MIVNHDTDLSMNWLFLISFCLTIRANDFIYLHLKQFMDIKQALTSSKFVTSAATPASLPNDLGTEIAFAGRSNAGKSSTINKLCGQKQLARASKTPGRTQLINFFTLGPESMLVDLPGYGYAKASQSKQKQWIELLEYYFSHRQALKGTVIVMDIRHPLQAADQNMIDWCLHHGSKVHVLLNKADKLSRNKAMQQLHATHKALSDQQLDDVTLQLFSAADGTGSNEVLKKLSQWMSE